MKLGILAANPMEAASTRYRIGQYLPVLRDAGIKCTFCSFVPPAAFRTLYDANRRGSTALKMLASGLSLARMTAIAGSSDVLWIEREAASLGPPLIEYLGRNVFRRPTVLDLDDALYEVRGSASYGKWLSPLKCYAKYEKLIAWASHVVCGNPSILTHVSSIRPVDTQSLLPTCVDTSAFAPREKRNEVPVIGWIGSHSTAPFLQIVAPHLQALAKKISFKVRIVGAPPGFSISGVPGESVPWSLKGEIAEFQNLDVGIYPLPDTAIARGKSAFKAIQYMACGVPFVASPVGMVTELANKECGGLLADTGEAWEQHLGRLLTDVDLRGRLGDAGRRRALSEFSAEHAGKRILEVIRSVAGRH